MFSPICCVFSSQGYLSVLPSRVCGREADFSFGLMLGKAGRLLDTRVGVPAGTPVVLRTPLITSVGLTSLAAGCTPQWSHKRLLFPPLHILLTSSKPVSIFSHHSTLCSDSFSNDHNAPRQLWLLVCKPRFSPVFATPRPEAGGRPGPWCLSLVCPAPCFVRGTQQTVCPIDKQMNIVKRLLVRSIMTNAP